MKQDHQSETTSSETVKGRNGNNDSQPQSPDVMSVAGNGSRKYIDQDNDPGGSRDDDEGQTQDVIHPTVLTEDDTSKKPIASTQLKRREESAGNSVTSQRSSRSVSPSPISAQPARRQQQQHESSSQKIINPDSAATSGGGDDIPTPYRTNGVSHTTMEAVQNTEASPTAPLPTTEEDAGGGDEERGVDWDDLERRFEEEMNACRENERKLREEWDGWVEVRRLFESCELLVGKGWEVDYGCVQIFHEWSSTGARRDEERARKRYVLSISRPSPFFSSSVSVGDCPGYLITVFFSLIPAPSLVSHCLTRQRHLPAVPSSIQVMS